MLDIDQRTQYYFMSLHQQQQFVCFDHCFCNKSGIFVIVGWAIVGFSTGLTCPIPLHEAPVLVFFDGAIPFRVDFSSLLQEIELLRLRGVSKCHTVTYDMKLSAVMTTMKLVLGIDMLYAIGIDLCLFLQIRHSQRCDINISAKICALDRVHNNDKGWLQVPGKKNLKFRKTVAIADETCHSYHGVIPSHMMSP